MVVFKYALDQLGFVAGLLEAAQGEFFLQLCHCHALELVARRAEYAPDQLGFAAGLLEAAQGELLLQQCHGHALEFVARRVAAAILL